MASTHTHTGSSVTNHLTDNEATSSTRSPSHDHSTNVNQRQKPRIGGAHNDEYDDIGDIGLVDADLSKYPWGYLDHGQQQQQQEQPDLEAGIDEIARANLKKQEEARRIGVQKHRKMLLWMLAVTLALLAIGIPLGICGFRQLRDTPPE